MTKSLDQLRRDAKALSKAHAAGDEGARQRVLASAVARDTGLKHADFLLVVAREAGYPSWPALKLAAETIGMQRADRQARLRRALFSGHLVAIRQLLGDTPDLAADDVPLIVATYDVAAMGKVLARDPGAATRLYPPRRPMCHLAFSQYFKAAPETTGAMLEMAELLLAHGADVNDSFRFEMGGESHLSALYGAIGHADNMALGRWLLEHGANPNDGESLYHATELGHHEGLSMLLAHGANPAGTNALARALDFDDREAVRMLLAAGADPNEGVARHPSGAPPMVIPALHQAARRMCRGEVVRLLLDHGADACALYKGHSPYALARVYGNRAAARVLEEASAATDLSPVEAQLARAADGTQGARDWIDMAQVSDELKLLLTRLVWREGTLDHMKRLIEMGFDANQADEMGLPPIQLAGWEGLPEKMAYFLRLRPDLGHVNGYGGSLLSSIVHGSENCPQRATRDHIACARMALEHGVALPRVAPERAMDPAMSAFLADWAEAFPGQVVAHGVM